MANIVFQSTESIYGKSLYANESIEYSVNIKIRNSGKNPVSLAMSFVPPYPFVQEVQEQHIIKAENLSQAFTKLLKFLRKYGFDLV